MTQETLLLVGRDVGRSRDLFERHAQRLRRRGVVDEVCVATFGTEPVRDLRDELASIQGERVYALPMCMAHTYDTTDGVPAALSFVPGDVRYCEPIGRSPAVTDVVVERATDLVPADEETSLVLVGFGNSSQPYQRQAVQHHAARIREQSAYGEVLTCFLLQNPAVECVRYNVTNPESVAVPLFVAPNRATEAEIPEKLELDRGGIEYADPLCDHPRVTDAIHSEVEKQRVLATAGPDAPATFEASLAQSRTPLATDGEGRHD